MLPHSNEKERLGSTSTVSYDSVFYYKNGRKKCYQKLQIGNVFRLLVLLGLISIIILAIIYNTITVDLFLSFLKWMKENILLGSVTFIIIMIISTVLMIPGSILTLGAGFVYVDILNSTFLGVLTATTVVWIAASIGATLSFINGRYLLRKCVVRYTNKYKTFHIIEKVVKEYGFSVTFWLRLSSITPYNVCAMYIIVRIRDYIFAHLGMIPDIAVYCFVGGSISEIVEIANEGIQSNITFIVVLVITLVISIVGMLCISYYAKKRFDKMVEEIKETDKYDIMIMEDDDNDRTSELQTFPLSNSIENEYTAV